MTPAACNRVVRCTMAVTLAAVIGLTAWAAGATEPHEQPRDWLAPPSSAPLTTGASTPTPWRIAGLVLFVGALGGAAVYLKRRQARGDLPGSSQLAVLSAVRVGPKAQLVVASVDGKRLLLGVTENSVRKLDWLQRTASAPESEAESDPDSAFAGVLAGLLQQRRAVDPEATGSDDPTRLPRSERNVDALTKEREFVGTNDGRSRAAEPAAAQPHTDFGNSAVVTISPRAASLSTAGVSAGSSKRGIEGQAAGLTRSRGRARS